MQEARETQQPVLTTIAIASFGRPNLASVPIIAPTQQPRIIRTCHTPAVRGQPGNEATVPQSFAHSKRQISSYTSLLPRVTPRCTSGTGRTWPTDKRCHRTSASQQFFHNNSYIPTDGRTLGHLTTSLGNYYWAFVLLFSHKGVPFF
jgi:hypothetical protein